ncbi:MAG: PD-(D/E)XK nuclease family protein [Thermus sp.]
MEPPVITPNRAVARRLGVPYRTLAGLARERLGRKGLAVASPFRARRLLGRAVEETLGSRDSKGMAAALEGAVRAVLRTGKELEGLEGLPPRAERLVRVARRYRELLRKEGLVDPAEALAEGGKAGEKQPLEVRGYPYLGEGELAFLKGAASTGSPVELLLPQGPWGQGGRRAREVLEGAGLRVEPLPLSPLGEAFLLGREIHGGLTVEAFRFPSMEEEVRYVLGHIKDLLQQGVPARELALVARDDRRYGPLVAAVGFEYGLPVRLLYGIPVGETRVGGLVALLAEALEGFPYEATLRLLFHPLFPLGREGMDLDRIRRVRPQGEEWLELGLPEEVWELGGAKDGKALALGLREFLHPLGERLRSWPRERLALEALLEGLSELEGESREGFLSGLPELLFHLTVPAQPGYGGLELHTPLARYGGQYHHLFVLGMAEGLTPPPLGEDPMLGFREAEALRERGIPLEEPLEAAAREALVFAALLGSVREDGWVHLTYPEVVDRDPAPPSPFLERLGLHPKPPDPRARRVGSRVEARRLGHWEGDPLREHAERALGLEEVRYCEEAPPQNPWLPESLSVSALEDLVTCPFRFYVRHRLRLRGDGEAGDGEQGEVGSFLHEVLAEAVRQALGAGKREGREVREHLLEGNLERVFSEVEGRWREDPERSHLMRRRDWPFRRARLLGLLRKAAEKPRNGLFPEGSRVEEVEKRVEGTLEELGPIRIVGRVDRVDHNGSSPVLLDYKLGSNPPRAKHPEKGDLSLDFQLPVYRRLLGGGGLVYYLLPKGQRKGAKVEPDPLRKALEGAAGRLKGDLYSPDPDLKGKACWGCAARSVCRWTR